MTRTLISALPDSIGQQVTIQGWLHAIRNQKSMVFLIIRDATGLAQATIDKSQLAPAVGLAAALASLTRESAVSVTGQVVANPIVRLGGLEVVAESLRVVGPAASPLPLDPQSKVQPSSDLRLDWRFLDLRRPENLLLFQIQTTAEMAMREFWVAEGFVEIHSPKLVGSATEGGAEVFQLEYFGHHAYLAQSPQFYKQMAIAAGFEKVFEIGPAFRADPSFTIRHATEFTSIDMELGWIESHFDVIASQERWLADVFDKIEAAHGQAIKDTFGIEVHTLAVPFPKVTMAEAHKILQDRGYVVPEERKGDLDPQGERLLGEYARRTFGHDFIYVTDWPRAARPFYHMRYENEPEITKSFDLLFKGVEIATGAQREYRYDMLVSQVLEQGLKLEPLQFYLDFFKYDCPPHGGFGFGPARLIAQLLNRGNVREVMFLFRGPTRLEP